jgi:hypothetical protein
MRQLAEMDYKICFRNELINKQVYCRLDEKVRQYFTLVAYSIPRYL